jgi:hypothetical protein
MMIDTVIRKEPTTRLNALTANEKFLTVKLYNPYATMRIPIRNKESAATKRNNIIKPSNMG